MDQSFDLTFEERMEREVESIHRKMDILLQAVRVLGQALSVQDRLELLIHSLHTRGTDPGANGE